MILFRALLLLSFCPSGLALEVLSESAVLSSALKHHPMIIQALREMEASEQIVIASEGAFDIKLKGEVDNRLQGFYDGNSAKGKIVKPFSYLNSEIYAGMRKSAGDFPVYEGKTETLSGGEQFLGVSVSLIRDALIDLDRYKLQVVEQDLVQSDLFVQRQQLMIQTLALKAYWYWVVNGYELRVAEDLLKIAEDRIAGLNRRIRAGDLAKIYATENQKYVLQRKVLLEKKQQDFAVASYMLSLFHRNEDGAPISISAFRIPDLNLAQYTSLFSQSEVTNQAIKNSLEIKTLDSKLVQKNAKRRLGQNDILPKADLSAEWSNDNGNGSSTLEGQETRVMLNVEIPLQMRKGFGKMRAAKSEIRALETKKTFTMEKIKVKSSSLVRKLQASAKIIDGNNKQISMSAKLAEAERRKFRRGASDLILVNLREQDLAETRIKFFESVLKWHYLNAEIHDLMAKFIL